MPTAQFTKQDIPKSAEEFKRMIREALRGDSPVDDFAKVVRSLALYEQKYGMESQMFYERFQRGEMGDAPDFMRWATQYEIYRELKHDLDQVLTALERYAIPATA